MKNKILIVGIALLSLLMFTENVEAACASYAYVDGESICVIDGSSSSNKAGTAYNASSSGNVKIVLNNYNGGSIEFKNGLGSNPTNGVVIELIGDNYITNETGYGILSYITGINFVGDGTLSIKSKMPFVSYDAVRDFAEETNFSFPNSVSTVTITVGEGKKVEEKDETISSDNEKEEITTEEKTEEISKDEENNLTTIALIVSSSLSVLFLIIIICLAFRNNKNN